MIYNSEASLKFLDDLKKYYNSNMTSAVYIVLLISISSIKSIKFKELAC